ncbi:MAG: DEAD/DEAH box helicase [Vulcanococcus sp.]|jgi:ribosomal protein L40E|uniref:DEAD/DEAH box helicase n=1 Tax=Vulcanococcus sp. TaxID=2856995 RepID=UPI0025F7FC42|nr:DEAD/DEAH box helicase [Vulcanococcus sp.]MBW0181487.1 DEAD/DEAH box helicase [Vulcanococcus sp.]
MALNPVVFTEKVVRSFLRYQLTAYPFADERLLAQMRELLSLDATRNSPLLKGPFVSVSRPFRRGAAVDQLISEGVFHPHMRQRIPAEITHVYGHQDEAIRAIHAGQTTLVSTGTGSGKSECFLYPITSKSLTLRDENAPPGISAVIVYPMNALAEDQLGRLRSLLAGTGITFGMYVGKTPELESDVAGIRLPRGASRADYEAMLKDVREQRRGETVYPPEEVCSREEMRRPGGQPRILLTNVKQLELLLTRQRDTELFNGARLDFLVFDEAHTFTGAQGAETACLIRRLRAYCGRAAQDTVCVATSATIVDQENPNAAREFASRFFGVPADAVTTVGEAYERETWGASRSVPPAPQQDPAALLAEAVDAVEDPSGEQVRAVYRKLAGQSLPEGDWAAELYQALASNEIAWQLAELLASPTALDRLPQQLLERVQRPVTEEEVLAWLTLGAAARSDNRPLLRPVVHAFVRGISGAVVTFPSDASDPKLWLAAEDELHDTGEGDRHAHFPVTTCTTCGQHYFIAFLKDFQYTQRKPGGGEASDDTSFWEPLAEAQGGRRVVLVDRVIGGSGDDSDDELEVHERTAALHFCRSCGAAHPEPAQRCLHCGAAGEMVRLYAIRQNPDNPGHLTSCLSCGANGRRSGSYYREPARPVRATNVADVHVLAQDMVHHSERPRLLVFCDNRQDAAFQAGWMKDHARRFRLRALMAQGLSDGPISVGDLARFVDDQLDRDESLSRALVPEVWQVQRKEGGGGRHEQERRKFLRIQVLREVTLSSRQAIGLEPWGRMKVEYEGLKATFPWIQSKASDLGMPPEDLRDGVASVLDYLRRKRVLRDPEREIFSKYWMDGDLEIQQGYLPQLGAPNGTKLRRDAQEKSELVTQWFSDRGDTVLKQVAKKWGVDTDDLEDFLRGLFRFLVTEKLLLPVTLKGSKGKPLPQVSGVYQVDADKLRLQANRGIWRCCSCRRRSTRRTPHNACLAWRCNGTLEFIREDQDNYDLQLLDEGYSMLRPEEHTAMVPHDERERLENLFRGESDAINAFVCTPTLELGVDIGQLDAVLMRNVPPLPANYWQRAGRAGRRHRMAVDITYCRPVSHDRAYFTDPPKLLAGRVDPPAFNLRNELMVGKHVHATAITRLHQYTRDASRTPAEREAVDGVLKTCLPDRISSYLFDGGLLRTAPFDLSPLRRLIDANLDDLCSYVEGAFRQGWPSQDAEVTTPEALRRHVAEMVPGLELVLARLNRRLRWALDQIKRLNGVREEQGTLEPEDDALFRRCDALVKRLKGTASRGRREAEGYDDVNTFGVLAAEGFLPGYGLEVGSVLGTAEIPFWRTGAMAFTLPRPPSVALREYVPGNLIYANGNRFVARRFHRDADEKTSEVPVFEVVIDRQAVKPTNQSAAATGLGSQRVQAISVCDVDLVHQSHISDEEDLRFQLPVAVFGLERDQHNGGRAFQWGEQPLQLRRGVRLRLVNVGASRAIERTGNFGYPVCTVCGQSISPLSSDRQRTLFDQNHKERCGREISPLGFYADVVADALTLPGCPDQTTAYSVLEALRFAAAQVLDMTMDDLQVLVLGHVDRDDVDAVLWDPMPGGSGLLDQICERFSEIVAAAKAVVDGCPSGCDTSCIDCLQTFRNGFYHKHLDRKLASQRLIAWGDRLQISHDIPAVQPSQAPGEGSYPVNEAERRLQHLLLAAGFEQGIRGEQLQLDRAIGSTTPDVIYRASHHDPDEGVCIYLDGLSAHLHGAPATAEKDAQIRSWLRNNGYDVIEIAVSELSDESAMTRHFRKLAGYLNAIDLKQHLRADTSWFSGEAQPAAAAEQALLRIVDPAPEDRYVNCLPLIPLKAAAGLFSDPQLIPEDSEWEQWVFVEAGRKLRRGMFVAQVVGKSMEPRIPDGSYCLFSTPVEGSRQGKIVLAQLRTETDPESGARYTVKRYESEKTFGDNDTWRHVKIKLIPMNKAFGSIHLEEDDEENIEIIAEFLQVL